MLVTARVVLNISVEVDDAETEQEAKNRVAESEFALLGWDDHEHTCLTTDVEVTSYRQGLLIRQLTRGPSPQHQRERGRTNRPPPPTGETHDVHQSPVLACYFPHRRNGVGRAENLANPLHTNQKEPHVKRQLPSCVGRASPLLHRHHEQSNHRSRTHHRRRRMVGTLQGRVGQTTTRTCRSVGH